MTTPRRRAHLRAPLKEPVLYTEGDFVLKAMTLNISEGGILLENLPQKPQAKNIFLMICLPDLLASGERKMIKAEVEIVRSFEGMSPIESIFVSHIGCRFEFLQEKYREDICQYVKNFSKNLVYLLGLFESGENKKDLIEKTAHSLGYDKIDDMNLLRQKALHDYQSLEGL